MCNRFFLVLLVFPFVLFAQPCIVASGQTVAFTLSAGAKASWNNPITGIRQGRSVSKNGTSFSVYQLSNGAIVFKTSGAKNDVPLNISLFSLEGRKISSIATNGRTTGEIVKKLVPGIYLARYEAKGIILKTILFSAGRQP
jgi:hypothetical protein